MDWIFQGVVERDDAIKKAREDVLHRQKELEQQLQDEQLLYQELQDKYETACEKREAIKSEMHQTQQQYEKTKADYKSQSTHSIFLSIAFSFL